jgi:hypothetical protein
MRICGTDTPEPVISEHHKVEIVFRADYTENYKGFFGIFEFVDESQFSVDITLAIL